jgi:hypothetical protein
MRILFIGNSYTNRNDLPGMLSQLAAASAPPRAIETERVIANGASLRQHWNAGKAAELIRSQPWDAVVLQEQSTLPVKNRQRFHENVRLFAELVRLLGARLALYHTWARKNAPETQDVLDEAVAEIARETGALVLPVGLAWRRVRGMPEAPELYDPDGSHPTPAASYLAACVIFARLLGASPEGLPASAGLGLPADQVTLLQRVASAAVGA